MSKIGKKAIAVSGVQVEIKPDGIHYRGKHATGIYALPPELHIEKAADGSLLITPVEKFAETALIPRRLKEIWGLHRSLLLARLQGAAEPFECRLKIVGLGFKVAMRGTQMEFSLGYSDKKNFELSEGVTATVDKTGQKLALQSSNKELLGLVASKIRALRKPERYKGTGIRYEDEVIVLKAGKTK